ncbi:MAG: hypothetical protein KH359_03900 [Clostridiales bacterium]|nr:hypothetical protein [Clostridiales bacterium]
MEVAIIMMVIFLFTDIMVVGISMFAYAGKEEYSEGMIFGVHIPKEKVEEEVVQAIVQKYKRQFKKFQRWNMLLGILVCGLAFVGMGIFIIVWTVWLTEYIVGLYWFVYGTHRKMYDLKVRNGWVMESAKQIIYVDTEVSAHADKMPLSKKWYLLLFCLTCSAMLFPQIQTYLREENTAYVLFGITLAVNLFFFGFHWWIERRPTVVYSKNSQVNMVLNQLTKRMWTICLLACAVVNTAAWLYMSICMIKNQWLTSADFCIYILLQIIASAILMGGLCWLLQKKKEVMSVDTEMIETDDDVYWKNGWYSNPNDKRLFVQDRMCGMNYSMNMAKTSAKIFTAVISAVLIGCAVWIAAILVEFATTEVTVEMKNGIMDIRAASYDYQINTEDILAVKMIEEMPEDNFYRSNGGDTEKFLIGHFRGKETGKCMMFLYKEETPILEIQLKGMTVFLNSENEKETEEWYNYARDRVVD